MIHNMSSGMFNPIIP